MAVCAGEAIRTSARVAVGSVRASAAVLARTQESAEVQHKTAIEASVVGGTQAAVRCAITHAAILTRHRTGDLELTMRAGEAGRAQTICSVEIVNTRALVVAFKRSARLVQILTIHACELGLIAQAEVVANAVHA